MTLELVVSIIIYLAGAITEYESKGKVTQSIGYEKNVTCECTEVK